MNSRIPGRQANTPSPISASSLEDTSFYDRGLLDRSIGSVVLRSSGPTPPKARADGDVEKVKVYARIRPALRDDETPGALVWSEDTGQLTIFRPEAPVPHSDFVFDKVLGPTSSQADVYSTAVSDVVADVLRGYNGTILAYGQTGAGKTYTLGNTAPDAIGMIPRAAAELFSAASRDHLHLYSITMSYIQIYMEMIQDLLNPTADNLPIREDANGVFVAGACEVPVASLEECLHYLELGEQNRVFAFTHLNAHSSRSHAVVMLTAVKSRKYLTSEERAQAEAPDQDGVVTQKVTVGKLYMVDLAGSERLKKSKSVGLRATEARSINLSLTTLGMCISARAQDSPHVPFRDSKLTRLLQESLGGNAKTSLILCLSDVRQHADESLQSLQFGARAACVRNKPVVNERLQMRQLTAELLAALEENHERADGLEAALSQTKEERDMLQAALAREKAQTAKIVDALRAEAKARDEQAAKLAAQAELLSEHVQQLGQVQQQQGQLEMEMEKMRREQKAQEEAHQLEVAELQEKLAAVKAAAEEAEAAAISEREALKAEARNQQAQLAAAAQKQTSALAVRLAQERAAARDQAAHIHLALTRLQRALGELVSVPAAVPAHPPPPPPSTRLENEEHGAGSVEASVEAVPKPLRSGSRAGSCDGVSGGGGDSGGGNGFDGWGSVASSLRGRSEGSAWGSNGGAGAASAAAGSGGGVAGPASLGDATAGRRALWMANLAAAVASRRGASMGSAGPGVGSGGGGDSSGGSAVLLIKQALGMSATDAEAINASDGAEPPKEAAAVEGDSGSGAPAYAGAVAHLACNQLAATALLDKPFISPPCSSPRSLGGAAMDPQQLQLYGAYPSRSLPSSVMPSSSIPLEDPGIPLNVRGEADMDTATELGLADIDAALAAARRDLLADLGGSERAVQLLQEGSASAGAAAVDGRRSSVPVQRNSLTGTPGGFLAPASPLPTTPQPLWPVAAEAAGAAIEVGGSIQGASRALDGGKVTAGPVAPKASPESDIEGDPGLYPHGRHLGDDPSGASLSIPGEPQSLTVSSSSGGGGPYGLSYGEADVGIDDGVVNSYSTGALIRGLRTPFTQTSGHSAAAAATAHAATGLSLSAQSDGGVPMSSYNNPAARGGRASSSVGGLRLGSGVLNHNPAFDATDSADVEGVLKVVAEDEEEMAGTLGCGDTNSNLPNARIRELHDDPTATAGLGLSASSGPGAVATGPATPPWLRLGEQIADRSSGGGGGTGSGAASPSPEGSLSMLLPPPTPAQGSQAAAQQQAISQGQNRGSALFAGIQVQLDSLLEMAATLKKVKSGLEQRLEWQSNELARRHEEKLRLEAEAMETGGQLQASRAALATAEAQLADTLAELQTVRHALDNTVQELGRTREDLDARGQELQGAKAQLGATTARLEDALLTIGEASQQQQADRDEARRLAAELERAQAELSAERDALRSLTVASARNQEVTSQALAARHELQRQVRAANAIKRAYKRFKMLQLRSQVAAKQRALRDAEASQREREAAQAARAGQVLVQESVAAIQDAVGSILAAFVGRRYELEARKSLMQRLDKMLPSSMGTSAPGLGRHGGGPVASSTPAGVKTVGTPATRSAMSQPAVPTPLTTAASITPLRNRMGTNSMSLSMMLAAATMPIASPSPMAGKPGLMPAARSSPAASDTKPSGSTPTRLADMTPSTSTEKVAFGSAAATPAMSPASVRVEAEPQISANAAAGTPSLSPAGAEVDAAPQTYASAALEAPSLTPSNGTSPGGVASVPAVAQDGAPVAVVVAGAQEATPRDQVRPASFAAAEGIAPVADVPAADIEQE